MRTNTPTTTKAPAASKAAPYISLAKRCRDAGITESQLAQHIAQQARELRAKAARKATVTATEPEAVAINRWLQIPLTYEDQGAWMQKANVENRMTTEDWAMEVLRKAASAKRTKAAPLKFELPPNTGARLSIRFTAADAVAFTLAAEKHGLTSLEWAYRTLRAAWSPPGQSAPRHSRNGSVATIAAMLGSTQEAAYAAAMEMAAKMIRFNLEAGLDPLTTPDPRDLR